MAAIISQVIAHATEQELRSNKNYVQLKKDLECQAILMAEYRCVRCRLSSQSLHSTRSQSRSFFSIIELLGANIFKLVADRHRQRDAVLETEAARMDDFIERIQHAAD